MINSGREMTWCSHCGRNCNTSHDYTTNNTSCVDCGKVLFDDIYTEEATFANDAAGGAGLRSSYIKIEGASFKSHRRSLQKGKVSTNELICKNGSTNVSRATRQYKVRVMIWCSSCARKSGAAHDHTTGSVCCVDCGKILFEDINTKKATFSKGEAGRKHGRKQPLVVGKSLNRAQTAAGQLSTKKSIPTNGSYDIAKEDPKELDEEMEELITEDKEDCSSKTDSHGWSYYNTQESYDYDYDYDYDGGNETDDSCSRSCGSS